MKKNFATIAIAALVLGLTVFAATGAQAYRGDPAVQGPNYTQERHEAMEKAFEKRDYNAWKNLMNGRGRVTQVINEKNFARFAQAHELAEQGKIEEARKIRQELGLGLRNGSGAGQGKGQGQGWCGRVNQ